MDARKRSSRIKKRGGENGWRWGGGEGFLTNRFVRKI